MYLYQLEDSQLTQISPNNSNYGTYFSSGSEGKITNIILNKGAQVLVRIYQTNHEELTCNVQPSWAIWDITSIENNSNTKTITTNTSGEEGKVWLAFGENIAEGKYTISTSSTSVTLKLYQDREEVVNIPNSGTDEQQGNTVTFEYQQNAVYQLGIATTQSSVNLTITKEPESETPDEGGNSSDSGDNSGEGDNTGEENNTSSDI